MIARCATDFTLSANYSGDQLLNSSIFLNQVDDTVRDIFGPLGSLSRGIFTKQRCVVSLVFEMPHYTWKNDLFYSSQKR